jgi:glutathionylspermidine synthase
MWRHASRPRPNWEQTVIAQGLVFPHTQLADGTSLPYWNETAWYEFTMEEVLALEAATEELWAMCLDAVGAMARDFDDARLGLPSGTLDLARESLGRRDPAVYARFDLRFDPLEDSIKAYELNGDTPTGLVETGVAQWRWLEDVMPDVDQWNSLHDRLVDRWRNLAGSGALPGGEVSFLYSDADPSGEEYMTTVYMQDTATAAGLRTSCFRIDDLGWNEADREFRDPQDRPVRNVFKLYPWEVMLGEEFGRHVLGRRERNRVRWIEPAWKVLLSTKALLPVLWQRNPDHRLLLPAYFDNPGDLTSWVAKPLHGREGDNVNIHLADGTDLLRDGHYGAEGWVYQAYAPPPSFEGNHVVLGSWIVDGEAAGMLVRESDGVVTDYYSRVVPHAIGDGLSPDEAQAALWRAERTPNQPPAVADGPAVLPLPRLDGSTATHAVDFGAGSGRPAD